MIDIEVDKPIDEFHRRSAMNFTTELGHNININFLNISKDAETGNIITTVFRKPMRCGNNLNARNECPDSYKESIIKALIYRTYKICSQGNAEQSINTLKQSFINYDYPNTLFDTTLHKFKSEHGMDYNRLNSQNYPLHDVLSGKKRC